MLFVLAAKLKLSIY